MKSAAGFEHHGVLARIWARKFRILVVAIITFVALFVLLGLMPPQYQSSTRIFIEHSETGPTGNGQSEKPDITDRGEVASQSEIIQSDAIARAVIAKLNLEDEEEFTAEPGFFSPAKLSALFNGPNAAVLTRQERVMARFREKLTVEAFPDSRVIVVTSTTHDIQLAKKIPNAIAREYLETLKDAAPKIVLNTTEELDPEIENLLAQVKDAERALADLPPRSDIPAQQGNTDAISQQISQLSSELARLNSEKTTFQSKIEEIRNAKSEDASLGVLPEVQEAPLIQRLREGEIRLQAEISEMETTHLPNHPSLKALNSQLRDFRRQIRIAAQSIVEGVENNLERSIERLERQEADLADEIDRLGLEASRIEEETAKQEVMASRDNSEREQLEGKLQDKRDQLESYLRNSRKIPVEQEVFEPPETARIISSANLPVEPSSPKILPVSIAGTLFMVLAYLVVIALAGPRRVTGMSPPRPPTNPDGGGHRPNVQTNRTEEPVLPRQSGLQQNSAPQAERPLAPRKLPPLISLPEPSKNAASKGKNGHFSKPFAGKMAKMVKQMSSKAQQASETTYELAAKKAAAWAANEAGIRGWEVFSLKQIVEKIAPRSASRIIVVTPGVEKSPSAAGLLACEIGKQGRKTIVLDLTAQGHCSMAGLIDVKVKGLRDILGGNALFQDVVYYSKWPNVHVVPIGTTELKEDPATILNRLRIITEALEERYECVILDCGNTALQSLTNIARKDNIILVNGFGSNRKSQHHLANRFRGRGYLEVFSFLPSKEELTKFDRVA